MSQPRGADEAKLKSYGQHLSQECTSCHRVDGIDNGIPSITGWPVEVFMRTLRFYQEGARTNPVMVSVAKSLDDDQVRALALYWSSVPRVLPKKPQPQGRRMRTSRLPHRLLGPLRPDRDRTPRRRRARW